VEKVSKLRGGGKRQTGKESFGGGKGEILSALQTGEEQGERSGEEGREGGKR